MPARCARHSVHCVGLPPARIASHGNARWLGMERRHEMLVSRADRLRRCEVASLRERAYRVILAIVQDAERRCSTRDSGKEAVTHVMNRRGGQQGLAYSVIDSQFPAEAAIPHLIHISYIPPTRSLRFPCTRIRRLLQSSKSYNHVRTHVLQRMPRLVGRIKKQFDRCTGKIADSL